MASPSVSQVSSASLKIKPLLLDGSNYMRWKKIIMGAINIDLEYTLTLDIKTKYAGLGADMKEKQTDMKNASLAFSFIWSALDDDLQDLWIDMENRNMFLLWKSITHKYETKSIERVEMITRKLDECKMKDDGTEEFDAYASRLKALINQLINAGGKMEEQNKITKLLRGLPQQLQHFASSLRLLVSREDDGFGMSYDDVCVKITNEIDVSGVKLKDGGQDVAAYAGQQQRYTPATSSASSGGGGYRGGRGGGRGGRGGRGGGRGGSGVDASERTCWTCQQKGHTQFYCELNKDKKKCTHCKKLNHTIDECFTKDKPPRNMANSAQHGDDDDDFSVPAVDDEDEDEQLSMACIEKTKKTTNNEGPTLKTIKVIWDTGATKHMVHDKTMLTDIKKTKPVHISVADRGVIELNEAGRLTMVFGKNVVTLEDVYYSPRLGYNLLSVCTFGRKQGMDHHIEGGSRLKIIDANKNVIVDAPLRGNACMMEVSIRTGTDDTYACAATTTQIVTDAVSDVKRLELVDLYMRLHCQLGHMNTDMMNKIIESKAVSGLDRDIAKMPRMNMEQLNCQACILGKSHRKAFTKLTVIKADEVLDVALSDLIGPIWVNRKKSIHPSGWMYVLTIVEGKTKRTFVFVLKHKSDTTDRIIEWHKMILTRTGRKLKQFHSDGGGEFISTKLLEYWKDQGVLATTTTKGTPQHNAIAERTGRTMLERARSMLHHSGVSMHFWVYAVLASVNVMNRSVSASSDKTPDELMFGIKPSIEYTKTFGCNAYINIVKEDKESKLSANASPGIHLGYDYKKMGYLIYDLASKKVFTTRDVTFQEERFTIARGLEKVSMEGDAEVLDDVIDGLTSLVHDAPDQDRIDRGQDSRDEEHKAQINPLPQVKEESVSSRVLAPVPLRLPPAQPGPPQETRHSTRSNRGVPEHRPGMVSWDDLAPQRRTQDTSTSQVKEEKDEEELGLSLVTVEYEPETYQEAMNSVEDKQWNEAIQLEYAAHAKNETWRLVNYEHWMNVIGAKLVLRKKINDKGEIRFKARAVAKGYTQQHGIDYNETFAPTLKYKSLRTLLALAASNDYEIQHMDVKTAFLNATIREELYMEVPPGLQGQTQGMVCKLLKALYGTKQAPHEWNAELDGTLVAIGFKATGSDPCIYVKVSTTGNPIIVPVFVDDLIPMYASQDEMEWLEYKSRLMKTYAMEDLGNATWVLGMKITRDRKMKTLVISSEVHVVKMLHKFGMQDCHAALTPVSTSKKDLISIKDCPPTIEKDQKDARMLYNSMVGSLNYIANTSRPDISYAASLVSRYMQNPGPKHITACKRIMRYLQGTSHIGMTYDGRDDSGAADGGVQIQMDGFCDADWDSDTDDRKSTTGYIIKVNGCTVSWRSKKQQTVALSSSEAEYYGVSEAVREIMFIGSLLREVTLKAPVVSVLHCDNKSAIAMSHHDTDHNRRKHIDIKHKFIEDELKKKTFSLVWIAGPEQVADILTKALDKVKFNKFRKVLMNEE